jgi:hypothetical protein
MGIRFHRSIRIVSGVRINLARRGPSLSFGGVGSTLNVSRGGVRTTVGIPGSGLSFSTSTHTARKRSSGVFWVSAVLLLAGAIVALIRTKI